MSIWSLRILLWRQELAQSQWRWRCEESGGPPVEAALRLGGAQLSAGQRHGFENFFVREGGLDVEAFGLGRTFWLVANGRTPILFCFVHQNLRASLEARLRVFDSRICADGREIDAGCLSICAVVIDDYSGNTRTCV